MKKRPAPRAAKDEKKPAATAGRKSPKSPSRADLVEKAVASIGLIMRQAMTCQQRSLSGASVSGFQLKMLFFLAHHPAAGAPVKDMAKAFSVTPGAVSQFVDPLIEKGLVARKADAADRRVARIALTAKAKSAMPGFRRQFHRSLAPIFSSLGDEELSALSALLAKAGGKPEKPS